MAPAEVAAVHLKSVALRRRLLAEWTFAADGSASPGYYSSFAAAPIQHIIAAIRVAGLIEHGVDVVLAVRFAGLGFRRRFGFGFAFRCGLFRRFVIVLVDDPADRGQDLFHRRFVFGLFCHYARSLKEVRQFSSNANKPGMTQPVQPATRAEP